jgi:hypothetical protein
MARIIATATEAAAVNKCQHRVVNILAVAPNDPSHNIRTVIQHTAAQIALNPNLAPTYVAAGAAGAITPGLPIIYINGYSAPN